MKRIATATVLVSCALSLLASGPTFAQQMATQKKPPQRPPGWKTLAEGVEVIRLWKLVPRQDREPEIAILRLSEERHAELEKAPSEFINKYEIFPKPVDKLEVCPRQIRERIARNGEDTRWIVALPHWPDTYSRCASFQGWQSEPRH